MTRAKRKGSGTALVVEVLGGRCCSGIGSKAARVADRLFHVAALLLVGAAAMLSSWPAAAASPGPPLEPLPERPIETPVMPCEALASHDFTSEVVIRVMSATVQPTQADRGELCLVKGY